MKKFKTILITLLLTSSVSLTAQNYRIPGIDYSDFLEKLESYEKPIVLLFGSNMCGNSRQQLKLLRETVERYGYNQQVEFYCVNADTDENYEWLSKIYDDLEAGERGTPTWIFFYADSEGSFDYLAWVGVMSSSQLREGIAKVIQLSQ